MPQGEEMFNYHGYSGPCPKPPLRTHDTAVAGPAWSEIARSAYKAYSASTGNKNFRGDPMPEFDVLPDAIKTAWQAAVRQTGDVIKTERAFGMEQHWEGWVPP